MTPPRIWSAADWHAAQPRGPIVPITPNRVVVHAMANQNRHPAGDPETLAEQQACIVLARQCQESHFARGFIDTGQNFTVWRSGLVSEGRRGSLTMAWQGQTVQGAHCADPDVPGSDWNPFSIGIELEGTYTEEAPPAVQVNGFLALCAWLMAKCHIDSHQLYGHRQSGCRTECPGDPVIALLPGWKGTLHDMKEAKN